MYSPLRSLADVNPSNALLWAEFRTQFDAATGSNLLVDGDMELANTDSWLASNATISKQISSPYKGTRCLRVAYSNNATGWAYQLVIAVNKPWTVSGWARGNGTSAPVVSDGTVRWTGTTSTDWQPFNVTFTGGTGPGIYFGSSTLSAGNYVEFDDVQVFAVKRVCENLARHPLAPRLLTLGDGSTANTIPGQIVGRHGLVFTGTQYVDTGIVDPFERTTPFTLFVAVQVSTSSGSADIISTVDDGQAYRGIALNSSSSENLLCYVQSNGANNAIAGSAGGASILRSLNTIAFTYNGSSVAAGCLVYQNAANITYTASSNTLSATIKNGKSFLLGARHVGANKGAFITGTMHFAAIFPWELTPQQVQYLSNRVMTRINAA